MHKRRWLPKPPVEAKEIDPRLLSKERKEYKRELEKARRLEYNARRREQRALNRLENAEYELQVRIKKAAELAEERYERKLEELRRETEDLRENLARLNARNRREPPRIQHGRVPDTAQPLNWSDRKPFHLPLFKTAFSFRPLHLIPSLTLCNGDKYTSEGYTSSTRVTLQTTR